MVGMRTLAVLAILILAACTQQNAPQANVFDPAESPRERQTGGGGY
jgi:outer membrane biogenesis lipoprotein LolB